MVRQSRDRPRQARHRRAARTSRGADVDALPSGRPGDTIRPILKLSDLGTVPDLAIGHVRTSVLLPEAAPFALSEGVASAYLVEPEAASRGTRHAAQTTPAPADSGSTSPTPANAPLPAGEPAPAPIASVGDLGRLVREAREERGLSQQAFADLAGVGRRFISELENGKPTIELGKALQVAAATGIDVLARRRG